jgi:hypothetical protein
MTPCQCFKTRPGTAGRPGSVAGPGLSKKQAGNWPGRPGGSTRDPAGPARPNPAETRVYFFLYPHARNDVVLAFYN